VSDATHLDVIAGENVLAQDDRVVNVIAHQTFQKLAIARPLALQIVQPGLDIETGKIGRGNFDIETRRWYDGYFFSS
jgi:hypothetical protein